jgi:hypothetical protein
VIEYSDSSVAATLHSSAESSHDMLFKALVAAACTFSNCPKMMSFEVSFELGKYKKSHGAMSGLYGGMGSGVSLFWGKHSLTVFDV